MCRCVLCDLKQFPCAATPFSNPERHEVSRLALCRRNNDKQPTTTLQDTSESNLCLASAAFFPSSDPNVTSLASAPKHTHLQKTPSLMS